MRTSFATQLALVFIFSSVLSVSDLRVSAQGCKNCTLAAADWTTLPSTYTHRDGIAVDQYEEPVQPTTYSDELRRTSVYRHTRSSLQGNNSTDHYHRVDQYGDPVQPYGEWRYPYRPYSVPYQAWGPQLPQFYSNVGGGYGAGWPYGPAYGQGGGMGGPVNGGIGNGGGVGPGMGPGAGHGYGPWQGNNNNYAPNLLPGPANALTPGQDEYYPDAPEPRPMSDRDFFYSPYKPSVD